MALEEKNIPKHQIIFNNPDKELDYILGDEELNLSLCDELRLKLDEAAGEFFEHLTFNTPAEIIKDKIEHFREVCKKNIEAADKIMGYGWLYRIAEVLIKAVVGLFEGIGMVLSTVVGQGFLNKNHREAYNKKFLTLEQTPSSKALHFFKQQILGKDKEDLGLLDVTKVTQIK
jgi:hypothetical protein